MPKAGPGGPEIIPLSGIPDISILYACVNKAVHYYKNPILIDPTSALTSVSASPAATGACTAVMH